MNTVSLFTFRESLPNKIQQQKQRKAKQTIYCMLRNVYIKTHYHLPTYMHARTHE